MDNKFAENARSMFITDGWKTFVSDIEANILGMRIENIEDEKAFWIAKGQLAVLHQILGYENMVYHAEAEDEQDL